MRKTLLVEIGWILCALVLTTIQTSVLINWNSGLMLNIITLVLAVLTVSEKKRAVEIAFISGGLMDIFSATPFGLHLITYLLLILLLYMFTHTFFHTSLLYTVGLSTAIAIVLITTVYRSVGLLFLDQQVAQLWSTTTITTLLWHGLIQGVLATLILWISQYLRTTIRPLYGI